MGLAATGHGAAPWSAYCSNERSARGSRMTRGTLAPCLSPTDSVVQHRQRRHVDPASFRPGLQRELRELDTLCAFHEVVHERLVVHDVAEELLPLHLERVVELFVVPRLHVTPLLVEVQGIWNVRIPHRTWRRPRRRRWPRSVYHARRLARRCESRPGTARRAPDQRCDPARSASART